MTAAGMRDDLAAVVQALTDSAAEQRRWQAEYDDKAAVSRAAANLALRHLSDPRGSWDAALSQSLTREVNRHRAEQNAHERHAAQARGTAVGYEVSVDMLNKYVQVT